MRKAAPVNFEVLPSGPYTSILLLFNFQFHTLEIAS